MKNKIIIIKIILIIFIVGLIGCIKENNIPNIKFEKEGRWLKVILVDQKVNWNDINITISSRNYSDIQLSLAPTMDMIYSYGNSISCPDSWGNVTIGNAIHFLLFNEKINVKLKWNPTNKIIEEWNFL